MLHMVKVEEVYEIIQSCAPKAEIPEINLSTKLLDDLEYDSLSIMELFCEIEKKYGVDCLEYEDAYTALKDAESLIAFIEEKMGGIERGKRG